MSSTGFLQVNTYTSNAQIPLKDVAVAVTDSSGSSLALRLTNRSGQLDNPIAINVPDRTTSQTPDTGVTPYTLVNLYAKLENFEEIEVNNIQIFPETVTNQDLELIPLSELPEYWNQVEIFNTSMQNL